MQCQLLTGQVTMPSVGSFGDDSSSKDISKVSDVDGMGGEPDVVPESMKAASTLVFTNITLHQLRKFPP